MTSFLPPTGDCTNAFFTILNTTTQQHTPTRPPPPGHIITSQNQHQPIPPATYRSTAQNNHYPPSVTTYRQARGEEQHFTNNVHQLIAMVMLTYQKYAHLQDKIRVQTKSKVFNNPSTTNEIHQSISDVTNELKAIGEKLQPLYKQLQSRLNQANQKNAGPGGKMELSMKDRPHHIVHQLLILTVIQVKHKVLTELFQSVLNEYQSALSENQNKNQFEHEHTKSYDRLYQSHNNPYDSTMSHNNNNNNNNHHNNNKNKKGKKNQNNFSIQSSFGAGFDDLSDMSDGETNGLLSYPSAPSDQMTNRTGKHNTTNNNNNKYRLNNTNHRAADFDPEMGGAYGAADNDPVHLIMGSLQQHQILHKERGPAFVSEEKSDKYYDSRQEFLTQIRNTMQDLTGMFSRLSDMVHQQEQVVMRIDTNIDEAAWNIDQAGNEINSLWETVSSNQWLLIKIFAIIIIFAIIFVTIIS